MAEHCEKVPSSYSYDEEASVSSGSETDFTKLESEETSASRAGPAIVAESVRVGEVGAEVAGGADSWDGVCCVDAPACQRWAAGLDEAL